MECTHSKHGCKCRFIVRNDGSGFLIGEHKIDSFHLNDSFDWRKAQARKMVFDYLVTNPNETPMSIIDKLLKRRDFVIDAFTPDIKYLKDNISYQRSKNYGKLPKSIAEINLDDVKTTDEERFLLFNSKYEFQQKGTKYGTVIGFSSNSQLQLLQTQNCTVLGDGTFTFVASFFCQMYTFHVLIEGNALPVLFVLMEHKCKSAYDAVFNYLKTKCSVNIGLFMSDFERSVRNSIREIYGNYVFVKGCWFHFCQSVLKKVKKIGLGSHYSKNPEVNMFVRRLFGLPFIEIEEVETMVEVIENSIQSFTEPDLVNLLICPMEYFRKTWVNGLYSIQEWNQLGDLKLRTNNWSEAFHSSFSRRFNRAHPNVFVTIQALKDVENNFRFKLNELQQSRKRINNISKEFNCYTEELTDIITKRRTKWNDNIKYLDALSQIPLRLLLKYEIELLKSNNINIENEIEKAHEEKKEECQ